MSEASVTTTGSYPRARWWAAVGIVSAVLGVALSAVWFVWALDQVDQGLDDLTVVTGSGEGRLVVDGAVDWTIYVEPADRSLSGIRFDIIDASTGEPVQLEPARNGVEYDVSGRSGRPLSRARLEPGEYLVALTPADATLAIGADLGDRVQRLWLGVLLIALPTVVGGGVVAAVNILRVLRSSPTPDKPQEQPAEPSEPVVSTDVSPPLPPGPPPLPPSEPDADASPPGPPAAPASRPPLPPPDPAKRRDR